MALNIIKLSVGSESVEDLAAWQGMQLARQKKSPRLMHVTRMTPKRRDEVLGGGSIYWVIKGFTCVRQRILDLVEASKGGVPGCGIVYDPEMIQVARRPTRAFQGWRYLKPEAAPPDLGRAALDAPPELQQALAELGLL